MKRMITEIFALIIAFAVIASCAGNAPAAAGESGAAKWLESKMAEQDKILWVYRDFTDGFNNFTQKAWMGSGYSNIPAMNEAADGHSGTSGIAAELDLRNHTWGGYMFLNGVLNAGKTEPELGFGGADAGLDLTGAIKLVFYAKGETGGERVEFFMGGLGWQDAIRAAAYPDSTRKISLGAVKLTKEWQRFELSLKGADLSRVACGFGWVANDAGNPGMDKVRFYIDDIRYEFEKGNMSPMFLQSYESAKPGSDDAVINNFAYLYDNAITAMALSYSGRHERARQIADAIVYAYEHDRFFTDGRMRNAYSAGNPASFPGWYSKNGKAFARMPGFYDLKSKNWYEDYYAVSTSAGNMAWAILALCEVGKHAPEPEAYIRTAKGAGDFVLTLKSPSGGFTGGYEGWEGSQVKPGYKSTEHNIDLIAAFYKLAGLTGEKKYADASEHAKAFVMTMYDSEKGCFYTGTKEDGVSVNEDVLPLDCNTWAILALKDGFKDGAKVLSFIEENMAAGSGYDFNEDRDGVWFEGTSQAALAYRQVGGDAKYRDILAYLNKSANADGSITAADRDGVTTGFLVSGTDIPWKYGKRVHIGAAAWLAFAQLGINPF